MSDWVAVVIGGVVGAAIWTCLVVMFTEAESRQSVEVPMPDGAVYECRRITAARE